MSEEVRLNLAKVGTVVSVLAGLAALLGAWGVLPYRVAAAEERMAAAEAKIATLQAELRDTREILIRIDENVKALKDARK